MSKKIDRKGSKTGLVVKWPTTPFFTNEDVFELNPPPCKRITLRVRLNKQIEQGKAAEIGCKTGEHGRPRKVYAFTPVSKSTLELARKQKVSLIEESKLQKLSAVQTTVVVKTQPVTA